MLYAVSRYNKLGTKKQKALAFLYRAFFVSPT